jgi:hypothetical protein
MRLIPRSTTPRPARANLAVSLVVALLLAAGVCLAASPEQGVVVRRTPGASDCPDGAALAAMVAAARATPAASVSGGPLVVDIDRDAAGLRAVVRMGDGSGTRELSDVGPSCAPLAEALAITLAILLDGRAGTGSGASSPAPLPAPLPVPALPEPWSTGGLSAGIVGSLGLLRAPALGATARLEVALRGPLSFAASILWLPPRSFDAAEGSVSVGGRAGALEGCARFGMRGTMLGGSLCAGPWLRVVSAEGHGFLEDRAAQRVSWAALAGAAIHGPLGPLGWQARAAVFAPVRAETLSVEQVGEVYRTPSVGGFLALELLASIW